MDDNVGLGMDCCQAFFNLFANGMGFMKGKIGLQVEMELD